MMKLGLETDLETLNEIFQPWSPKKRIEKLYEYFNEDDIFYTSSFGANSVCLLKLISEVRPSQNVHFLNTTFHFSDTLAYKRLLTEELGLNVIDIFPDPTQNALTHEEETWKDDPDLCCMVNKIVPIDAVKVNFRLWISGLIGFQTHFRSALNIFDMSQGMIKFNPLIDQTALQIETYKQENDLPLHPMVKQNYHSIGCTHCTIKGKDRNGRWQGQAKTECGLHLDNDKKTK